MKKIFVLLIVALSFILSGCGGSGGDADGNTPPPTANISTSVSSFEVSGNRFNTLINITTAQLSESTQIELNNFNVTLLNGCTVSNLTFNGSTDISLTFNSEGETEGVTIDGDFDCPTSTTLNQGDIQISYNKWILNNDGSRKRGPFPESVNLGNPNNSDKNDNNENGDNNSVQYSLYPDNELIVKKSEETYTINVGVSTTDATGTHPAVNTKVNASFLQPMFGTLESYSTTTDGSGIATFIYTSPKNIQNISDTYISFYVEDDTANRARTEIKFDPQLEEGVTKMYLIPQSIQVTTPGEEQTIKVITVNSENVGVSTLVEFEQLVNGDGNDYGTLSTTQVQTDNTGVGEVTYTAPAIITNQPTRTITVATEDGNIHAELSFNFLSPEEETGITNYEITVDTPKTISIEQNSSIAITIHEKGNEDKLISDDNVKSVTVSIKDYESMIEFTQISGNEYDYSGKATKSIPITTKTIAGVAILQIHAVVFNGEENVDIDTVAPVTIMSGPISSISLNYTKTEADENNGFYYDIFNVHAVDKYANPANPGAKFYPTLICGGNWNNPKASGTIIPDDFEHGSATIKSSDGETVFEDTTRQPFNSVDESRDRLIVLPSIEASQKDYIGSWSISNVDTNQSMILKEEYYSSEKSGLRYVIGDEDRLLNGEVHVAHIIAMDGSSDYKIDENGTAQIKVVYDPSLVGHTYSLSVTSYGENERTGTAIRDSFRGNGYASGDTVLVPSGETVTLDYVIGIITPTGATVHLDNVDLVPYSFTTDPNDKCWVSGSSSNFHVDRGVVPLDITAATTDNGEPVNCKIQWINNNSGVAYDY